MTAALTAQNLNDPITRHMRPAPTRIYAGQTVGDAPPAPQRDDLFQLIGVHLAQAQQTSPVTAFRHRFPWLLCNVAGGILAAFLAGLYQDELARVVELALFIPVVLALAESV